MTRLNITDERITINMQGIESLESLCDDVLFWSDIYLTFSSEDCCTVLEHQGTYYKYACSSDPYTMQKWELLSSENQAVFERVTDKDLIGCYKNDF